MQSVDYTGYPCCQFFSVGPLCTSNGGRPRCDGRAITFFSFSSLLV